MTYPQTMANDLNFQFGDNDKKKYRYSPNRQKGDE